MDTFCTILIGEIQDVSMRNASTLRIIHRMEWNERADSRRKELGITQQEIADALGVTRATVGHYMAGRRSPGIEELKAIASKLRLTPSQLLGTEPISNDGNAESVKLPPSEYVGVTKVSGASLSAGGGEVLWEIDEIDGSHAFRLDYLQGRGLRAERCRVWKVRGESMEPRYCSGDVVLIDMSDRTPVHGKVYALIGPEGLRIKQLRRTQSGWEMHSFNPDQSRFPPEPIIDDNYAIIGRVRWRGGDED